MNTLELFIEEDMRGQSVTLRGNTPSLASLGFNNKAMSLRAPGDPWAVFAEEKYGGDFRCYEGDHFSIPTFQKSICSAKIMAGGLEDPELIIYQAGCCAGKEVTLTREAKDFEGFGLEGKAESAKAIKGSWILYEKKNLGGNRRLIIAGEKTPSTGDCSDVGWKGGFLSAKPIIKRHLNELVEQCVTVCPHCSSYNHDCVIPEHPEDYRV